MALFNFGKKKEEKETMCACGVPVEEKESVCYKTLREWKMKYS